jgi:hypothetical protein
MHFCNVYETNNVLELGQKNFLPTHKSQLKVIKINQINCCRKRKCLELN